jgi:small subunit ribosomal protein S17
MRNIGIDVKPPERSCDDPSCPFHGQLAIRGKTLNGIVASAKMQRAVVVERDTLHYVPKYLRYEKRRSRISAHNPPCIEAKEGDAVRIAECRPLSKTVSFVVVERLQQSAGR